MFKILDRIRAPVLPSAYLLLSERCPALPYRRKRPRLAVRRHAKGHLMSSKASATIVVCVAVLFTSAGCGGNGSSTNAAAPPSNAAGPSSPSGGPKTHHTRATKTAAPSSPGSPAATEFNPPGDIPDNTVFVPFTLSRVHIKVPEGWARKSVNGVTTFTDHYNSIALQVTAASKAPTVASARSGEVPQLKSSVPKCALHGVTTTTRAGQKVVEVDYLLDSAPDQVTGKVVRDIANRFEFFHHGREAVLTLTGPQNADNVDPWRLVSNSLGWH
jgi:hypothetical protein